MHQARKTAKSGCKIECTVENGLFFDAFDQNMLFCFSSYMSALSFIPQGGSQYYHRQHNVGTTYTSVVSLMVDELQKGKSLSHQGDGKLIYDAIVLFRF